MGLAYIGAEKKITVTSFGETFLSENYDLGEIFFRSFLKWQYPNPDLNRYFTEESYNIKPLIATFHLIKKEFMMEFASSLQCYVLPLYPQRGFHSHSASAFTGYKKGKAA
jgi:hypothetical protein